MPLPCTYDIQDTWEANCLRGPHFEGPCPMVPPTPWKSFLGFSVRSRIGISAGLLPNSRWVLPYAERGFDILTYKTVRSVPRPSYPWPNWVFVEETRLPGGDVVATQNPSLDPSQISSSVCFGMPSVAPEEWRPDIRATVSGLSTGQLLIVSVVGTPEAVPSITALADDYAQCAAWAVEAGAPIIEANLSCPNVCSAEGTLYQDPEATRILAQRLRRGIGKTPLLLKIGAFPSDEELRCFLRNIDGIAQGVTLLNGISRSILRPDGGPVFGEKFKVAGLLGRAIHEPSVAAVRAARRWIDADRLDLAIVAVGGVSSNQDFEDFFNSGADGVLCGSSPMYLPNLAIDAKRAHPEW
jgi:dihydroorotate dehydrogenase (NAD+) catalytic subunit